MARKATKVATKSVIQSIAEFIATYPNLKQFDGLFPIVGTEIMEESPTTYMISAVPAEPVIKKYLDGSGVYQTVFALDSREYYDQIENIDTGLFYEQFSDWLTACSNSGKLPVLEGGLEPRRIRATTPGYVYDAEGITAKYRIQCVFEYYKPAPKL